MLHRHAGQCGVIRYMEIGEMAAHCLLFTGSRQHSFFRSNQDLKNLFSATMQYSKETEAIRTLT